MSIAVESLEVQVKSNAYDAKKSIDSLRESLLKLRVISEDGAGLKNIADALEKVVSSAQGLSVIKDTASAMKELAVGTADVVDTTEEVADVLGETEVAIEEVKEQVVNVSKATKKSSDAFAKLKKTLGSLTSKFKESESVFGKMKNSLGRVAFYRAIRSALSWLSQSLTEGLKNAYHFSQTIDGQLAPALDSLSTATYTLKNQLGSAFGEVLTALLPVITRIVNAITFLADRVSQVFALFNGKTQYKKAKNDYVKYWDDATASAKAYKTQTLGIDELNIISKDDGSGSSGTNYGDMFEMTDIDLPESLMKNIEILRDNLDKIVPLVETIGVGFGLWQIAKLVKDVPQILILVGAVVLLYNAFDAFNNGLDWKNLLGMVGGLALLAGGLAIKFGMVGGAIGLLIGGLVLLGIGIYDIVKKGEMTNKACTALIIGVLAIGGAIALLTGSWIPLAIAGVVGLALTFYQWGDKINEKIEWVWDKFMGFVGKLNQSDDLFANALGGILGVVAILLGNAKTTITTFITFVKDSIGGLIQTIKGIADGDLKEVFRGVLNIAFSFINALTGLIAGGVNVIIDIINSFGFDLPDWLKEKFGLDDFHLSIPHVSIPKVSAEMFFANGGFPESGSMFFANENGSSEYVGSFGNQSAVANNAQIVEGIQSGVTSAVSAVLAPYLAQIANNTRETANKDFSVNIGDRDIARANARGQRAMGMSIISTV